MTAFTIEKLESGVARLVIDVPNESMNIRRLSQES